MFKISNFSKKKQLFLLLGIVIIAFYFLFSLGCGKGQQGGMPPVAVEISPVKMQPWQTEIEAVGTLSASQGIVIKPEIAGRITAIYFQSGQEVAANAPLIQINPDVIKAQLDAAKARLASSKANYNRIESLNSKRVASPSELDNALSTYLADSAAVAQYQAMMDQTLIRAPFPGRLGLRLVNLGDYITTGQAITNLQDTDLMRVEFSVPETYLRQINNGDNVQIYSNDFPGKVFQGNVYAYDSSIDPNTRSLGIRASVPNKDGKLLPGSFVEVKLLSGKPQPFMTIPETALSYEAEGEYVYKIKDGMAIKTRVTSGEHKNNQVVILKGLTANDKVVSVGQFKIAGDSAPVIIASSG